MTRACSAVDETRGVRAVSKTTLRKTLSGRPRRPSSPKSGPSGESVRPSMSSDQIGSVAPTPPTALTSVANVLVVEDEMVLRMRAIDIVEDAGFMAVEAVSADEALSILESRSDISLLFSDIQMPGSMDGLTLSHTVHDRWPSIGIILVSGQVKLCDTDRPADSRFFGKPLEAKEMIAELRSSNSVGDQIIAQNMALNLDIRAYYAYSFETVKQTDSGKLLQEFLSLQVPRLFLYGERNKTLSYLPELRSSAIQVAEVPSAGHFLFYDNPRATYQAIGDFVHS